MTFQDIEVVLLEVELVMEVEEVQSLGFDILIEASDQHGKASAVTEISLEITMDDATSSMVVEVL